MSSWRVAKSLLTLQDEINEAHPARPRAADGTIGDARHQVEKSDHNPTKPHPGVVTAWDITTADFTDELAETLRLKAKAGDRRIKYLIYKGRVATRRDNWAWRPYTGFSAHFDHIHLSVSDNPADYDSTAPWNVTDQEDIVSPEDRKAIADLVAAEMREDNLYLAQYLAGKPNSRYNEKTVGIAPPPRLPAATPGSASPAR